MNIRMSRMRRFFLQGVSSSPTPPTPTSDEFTYYFNDTTNNTITTEFYMSQNSSVTVPATIDGYSVTEIGSTTFCLGALNVDGVEKPDNKSGITSVTISSGIIKI